jgi:rhodanese-related sulfurtransferase
VIAGRSSRFRGTQGTSVIGNFGATVAATGANEKLLIRLGQLRARLGELPRDREILIICRFGQRAYYATRILLQNGFKTRNIPGGMLSRSMLVAK